MAVVVVGVRALGPLRLLQQLNHRVGRRRRVRTVAHRATILQTEIQLHAHQQEREQMLVPAVEVELACQRRIVQQAARAVKSSY